MTSAAAVAGSRSGPTAAMRPSATRTSPTGRSPRSGSTVTTWPPLVTARIGGWSWSPDRAVVPPVEGPCLADEPADGDDGVGEVEERLDDVLVAFVAALEPVEGVVP